MKGITPVISTILLLLITVSLIGAVYMFFVSQTELTTKEVGEGTQNTLNALNTKVRIVFVDGVPAGGFWRDSSNAGGVTEIPVGGTVLFNADDADGSCEAVKIDTPGQSAAATC